LAAIVLELANCGFRGDASRGQVGSLNSPVDGLAHPHIVVTDNFVNRGGSGYDSFSESRTPEILRVSPLNKIGIRPVYWIPLEKDTGAYSSFAFQANYCAVSRIEETGRL
jgi:hypothetical protein